MRNLGKQRNLIVDSGPTFPSPDNGEIFIIDDPTNVIKDGLYWYSGKLAKWLLLAEIDELDGLVETKVDDKLGSQISDSVTSAINAQLPDMVTNNLATALPAAVTTEMSSSVPNMVQSELDSRLPSEVSTKVEEEITNRLGTAVNDDVNSKLSSAVSSHLASVLPAALVADRENNPPTIVADVGGSDVSVKKIIPSSIIRFKYKGDGDLELEYNRPTIELGLASSININSSKEIKVPFTSVIESDANTFTFVPGTSKIIVTRDGQYELDYSLNAEFYSVGRVKGSYKNSNVSAYLKVNGSNIKRKSVSYAHVRYTEAENATSRGNLTLTLEAGDYVELCTKRSGKLAYTKLIEEESSLRIRLMRDL